MIVCTGGSGTIGRHLPSSVHRLTTRLEASLEDRVAELRVVVSGASSFIHLAGVSLAGEAEAHPVRARALNIDGAVKWYRAAAEVGCQRFIFASSAHVFQPTDELEFIGTDRVPDAESAYGRSKADAEIALLSASAELNVELVIARIFSVIDNEMPPGFLYAELLRRVRERDFSPLRGWSNVRDFSQARLVAEQLWEFASAPRVTRTIHNVGSGVATSVRELAERTMQANGVTGYESMFSAPADPGNFLVARVV